MSQTASQLTDGVRLGPLPSTWRAAALLVALVAGPVGPAFAQAGLPDTTADSVYGQGSFTGITANRGQTNPSENTLRNPAALVTDRSGGLYITDSGNNRVLYFPRGSQIPSRVYGQTDSLQTGTANKGGVSASSLNNPVGVAVDSTNGLYITDSGNNRVLHYPSGSTTADRVYGQDGSFTTVAANLGQTTPSRTSLNFPIAVVVDSANGLYVADFNNNRVLHYPTRSILPDRVYGQNNSFTTGTANNGGISARSLRTPEGVDVDANDGLYIVDRDNNRVLHFSGTSTVADRVYGQGNSFTSGTANLGGASNESLAAPIQMAADNSGGLYIADFSNNRVLHYPAASIGIADRVYGQGNAFTTTIANKGGNPASADSLQNPFGVAVGDDGALYISDFGNHRVLKFEPSAPTNPTITRIETVPDPAVVDQQFTLTITGTNFNPATALIEFTGPDCNPCRLQNNQITTKSSTRLETRLSFTFAGRYSVVVRNGTGGPASTSGLLTVNPNTPPPAVSCGCDFNADGRVDISDVISVVRLLQNGTTPACRMNLPFTIADVIHVVNVVLGNSPCRL